MLNRLKKYVVYLCRILTHLLLLDNRKYNITLLQPSSLVYDVFNPVARNSRYPKAIIGSGFIFAHTTHNTHIMPTTNTEHFVCCSAFFVSLLAGNLRKDNEVLMSALGGPEVCRRPAQKKRGVNSEAD